MDQLSTVVLLFLTAIVLLNFFQGGPTQVKAWFAAKFLNKAS